MSLPKPYYEESGIMIYCWNNEEVLPLLEPSDFICTDPPYGLKFMGKKWDYDIPRKATWELVLKALKPGGHLFSFGGTRTYHRIVCEIEDAGFEIRDCIMWVYGSGFPKSLNVGKMVDKMQGNEREYIGLKRYAGQRRYAGQSGNNRNFGVGNIDDGKDKRKDTKGHSPWEGWGSALKPSYEPICIARKPLEGTVAENVLKYGTGGLNIDGSRIGTSKRTPASPRNANVNGSSIELPKQDRTMTGFNANIGRFPANLIHDGSEEVLELFPDSKSTGGRSGHTAAYSGGYKQEYYGITKPGLGDSGSAARFFYCAKASKAERNEGCEGLDYSETLYNQTGLKNNGDGTVRPIGGMKNHHPTVKPLKLMQYLIKMGCHKDGVVLDPFMGSGSTLVAAKRLGFKAVGIEVDEKYCEIASKRLGEALKI